MDVVLPDEVLLKILNWLPLRAKFCAARVSRQWRRVCGDLLSKQRCVVIAGADAVKMKICPCVADHPEHLFTRNEMLVVHSRLQSLQMMSSIFVHCPNLVALSVSSVFWIRHYDMANDMIGSIIERYADQLQCISSQLPVSLEHELPTLKHLSLSTAADLEMIYGKAQRLNALSFNELNSSFLFPAGLKVLKFMSEPRGLEQVFVSPAATTMETLSFRTAYNEHLESAHFFMPNLKSILFHGGMATEVMRDFMLSLQLSPELLELDLLSLMPGEEIPASQWTDLFHRLTRLRILRVSKPSIKSDVMESLVQSCKELQEVCLVDCSLDDASLRLLATLTNLKVLQLTFNDISISESGILSLLRGNSRPTLTKVVLYKCKGSFLTEEVRHDVLHMNVTGRLSVCKMSGDNGSFDVSRPNALFSFSDQLPI